MSGAESFVSLQVVDFAEAVDDRVAALLTAGTGITLTYNDGAGTLTIANTGLGGSTGSVANRVLTANGTGGSTVQASVVTIDESGNASGLGTVGCGAITASGAVSIPAGAAATPSLQVGSAAGFFQSAANTVSTVNNGTESVRFVAGGARFGVGSIRFGSSLAAEDVYLQRNSSGPALETRSAGGLRVRIENGSADAGVQCGAITASGEILTIAGSKSTPAIRLGATATNTGIYGSTTGTSPGFGFSVAGASFIATRDAGTGFCIHSAWAICWTSGQADGTVDTGLRRSSAGVVEINNGTLGTRRDLVARNITASALLTAGVYTVATLPSAAANAGALAQVTDSSVTTNGSSVSGSGSNRVVVFSNGSTWDVVVA